LHNVVSVWLIESLNNHHLVSSYTNRLHVKGCNVNTCWPASSKTTVC